MNAVNAVQLFILVWTFTVCLADKHFSVSCDGVTGSVGKEVNLTCRVYLQLTECCIKMYMFLYPSFNDSTICEQVLPVNSCDQSNSFTCSYTPTTAMTEQFRFYMRTTCGWKTTEFTVGITDSSSRKAKDPESKVTASKDTAIAAAVGCFSIVLIIIIIIIMTIICKTKPNFTKPCGFQKRMFLCSSHDEDNTTPAEDVNIIALI